MKWLERREPLGRMVCRSVLSESKSVESASAEKNKTAIRNMTVQQGWVQRLVFFSSSRQSTHGSYDELRSSPGGPGVKDRVVPRGIVSERGLARNLFAGEVALRDEAAPVQSSI